MAAPPLVWRLLGCVKVRVSSPNPARFLNLCVSSGLPVSGVHEEDGYFVFYTLPWAYASFRPVASRTRSRLRAGQRSGLWFLWTRLRRRKSLVATALALLGCLYYLSGSVWAVEVRGNEKVPAGLILSAAAKAGLYRGVRKASVSPEYVDSYIAREVPQVGWVYTSIHGTVALIEVREKVVRPYAERPGDIVAKRDGVVKSILVLSGHPLVRAGDVVKAGQILIAGDPSSPTGGARGEVVAVTWYRISTEVPLREVRARRTGRKVELSMLRVGNRIIPLYGFKEIPFLWYEMEEEDTREGESRATRLLISRTYYEIDWVTEDRTVEEASKVARQKLEESLRRQLPPSVKLIDFNTEVIPVPERGVVTGRLVARAEEDISVVRPWGESKKGP